MEYTGSIEILPYRHSTSRSLLNSAIIVIYLLLITNAFFAPIVYSYEQQEVENSLFFKILKYVVLIFFVIANKKPSLSISNLSFGDKLFFFVAFFYCISSLWSGAKVETLTNGIQFVIFIYFCYNLSKNNQIDLIKILKYYLIFTLFFSYILFLLFPSLGRMSGFHEGLARGVFLHKNVLGTVLTTLLPVVLCNLKGTKNFLLLIFTLILIYFSGSSSSLVTSITILILSIIIKRLSNKKLIYFLITCAIVLLALYTQYSDVFFQALGKSEDLTGRVKLWENLSNAISQKPYFGWGYCGFWKSSAKANAFSDMEWITGKAHNGYLDILLSGGWFLLIITLFVLAAIFNNILKIENKKTKSFSILSFILTIILCTTEIGFLQHNSINLLILYWAMNTKKSKTILAFNPQLIYPTRKSNVHPSLGR